MFRLFNRSVNLLLIGLGVLVGGLIAGFLAWAVTNGINAYVGAESLILSCAALVLLELLAIKLWWNARKQLEWHLAFKGGTIGVFIALLWSGYLGIYHPELSESTAGLYLSLMSIPLITGLGLSVPCCIVCLVCVLFYREDPDDTPPDTSDL